MFCRLQQTYLGYPFDKLLKKCDSVFPSAIHHQGTSSEYQWPLKGKLNPKIGFVLGWAVLQLPDSIKASVCTNVEKPSLSLIRSVCYLKSVTFSTKATKWGCDHEKTVQDTYVWKIQEDQIFLHLTGGW